MGLECILDVSVRVRPGSFAASSCDVASII